MKAGTSRKPKPQGFLWSVILVGSLALPAAVSAEDDPFYRMMCSYSRDMGFAFGLTVGPRGRAVSGEGAEIEFLFDAGTSGFSAAPNSLQPGQCTWMDRALTDNEPRKVKLFVRGVTSFRFRNTRDGSNFLLTGPTRQENRRDMYDIIYSMRAAEGTKFTLSAQRAAERHGRFTIQHDYFHANEIQAVAQVKVPAR